MATTAVGDSTVRGAAPSPRVDPRTQAVADVVQGLNTTVADGGAALVESTRRFTDQAAHRTRPLPKLDDLLKEYDAAYLNSYFFKGVVLTPLLGPIVSGVAQQAILTIIQQNRGERALSFSGPREGANKNSQDLLQLQNQYKWLNLIGTLIFIAAISALLAKGIVNPSSSAAKIIYVCFAAIGIMQIYNLYTIRQNYKTIQQLRTDPSLA